MRLPFVALSLLIGLSAWVGAYPLPLASATLYYCLLLLTATGVLVSGLLVWYSLDADNPFLRSICQLNSHTNCSAVLNTSAAKLFSWLSWAEVGLFYFGGSLLALVFFRADPTALYPLLFGLSIAALPYTLWSVYYQWQRARQWCVLCLTVQGLLWLEFGALLFFQRHLSWMAGFSSSAIGLLAASFLLLPALWALLKPVWSKALRTDGLQQSLQKIKFDPGYIESLSQRARTLPPIFTGMRVPTLGNADAPHTLTVVTSPTCSVCAREHVEIEKLMTELENTQCQFILAISQRHDDVSGTVASFILSHPTENMTLALHEWYTTLHIKDWLKKNALTQIIENGQIQLKFHLRWCELTGINATPTVFFNGIEIPRHYTTMETKRLINLLKEENYELV